MNLEMRDRSKIPSERVAWLRRRAEAFARVGADGKTPSMRADERATGGSIGGKPKS